MAIDLDRAALIMLLQGKPCVVCKAPLHDDSDGMTCGLCSGFVHRKCVDLHVAEHHASAAPPREKLVEPFAAFIASARTCFQRSPYIGMGTVEPSRVSAEDQARAGNESTPPQELAQLARTVPRIVMANPAADEVARESARITLARWSMAAQLSAVSEHGRASWLVDWIEHARDEAAALPASVGTIVTDALDRTKRMLAGDFVSVEEFEVFMEPLQHAYDASSTSASQAGAPVAVLHAAHLLAALGALSGSLYHALRWFLDASAHADGPARDWFMYRVKTNRWLPMWDVAYHCIAIGRAPSAEWAAARMQSYARAP